MIEAGFRTLGFVSGRAMILRAPSTLEPRPDLHASLFYRPTFYGHRHPTGRRQRIVDPAHFHGVAGVARPGCAAEPATVALREPALLRPLAEYEQVVGGGWS